MSQLGNHLTGFCLVAEFVVNQDRTEESAAKRCDRLQPFGHENSEARR
ncbi:hypothetical protein [Coleofasciculus sp. FACHB-1120]|nr:hypothetical protein [Coleofasciculus sp. FACHB-1120]